MAKTKYSNNIDNSNRQNFFCKISIDNVELIPQNIINCTIREWVFNTLPRIELLIMDDGIMSEAQPITDESVIHLELGVSDDDIYTIDADFNIHDYSIDVASQKVHNISITGILKNDGLLYPIKNRAFSKKTSLDVLRVIASEANLNFITSDGLNVSDLMTWLQLNKNNFDMIKHIVSRAYRPDDALLCYGTLNGNLNCRSLKTEVEKIAIIQAKYDLELFSCMSVEEQDKYKREKQLKLNKQFLWFNSYNLVDLFGTTNKKIGYGKRYSYYDHKVNNSNTITKGVPALSDADPSLYLGEIVNNEIFGLKTDNTHDNYFKSIIQNQYIISTFFQQSILLNVNALDKVELMDKVELFIPSVVDSDTSEINDVLSGEYLVGGITHNVTKGSTYRKQVSVHRSTHNKSVWKI